jgi:HEAT repeat protein
MSIRTPRATAILPAALVILASAFMVSADDQEPLSAPSLADLSDPTKTLTVTQLSGLAQNGVRDQSASVRRRALQGVAQRVRIDEFRGGPDRDVAASDAREAFEPTKPFIESALADPDEQVRQAAAVAIGALGAVGSPRRPVLDRSTLQLFDTALSGESSPMVQAEMMKTIALTPAEDRILRQQILTRGLASDASAILQYALRGVSDDQLESTAPRVVELLQHDDRGVRNLAAAALQRFPSLPREHLRALRTAHDKELDVSTKSLLESVIQRLEARRQ